MENSENTPNAGACAPRIIAVDGARNFRVDALQAAGRFVDAEGNALDSGNTLVGIVLDAETPLPEEGIRAALGG